MPREIAYSDFEITEGNISFHSESQATAKKIGCIGSMEEALESKVITKKCEGIIVKSNEKGTGNGELKVTLHMGYANYIEAMGMNSEKLKSGVNAYGKGSQHKSFCFTAVVMDEDGERKLKAYPNCIMTGGVARKIENGAEEVAELEATFKVMPDSNGYGMYEAIESEVTDTDIKEKWLTEFTPELVSVETI